MLPFYVQLTLWHQCGNSPFAAQDDEAVSQFPKITYYTQNRTPLRKSGSKDTNTKATSKIEAEKQNEKSDGEGKRDRKNAEKAKEQEDYNTSPCESLGNVW